MANYNCGMTFLCSDVEFDNKTFSAPERESLRWNLLEFLYIYFQLLSTGEFYGDLNLLTGYKQPLDPLG